jgi:TatD DNase family protein
MSLIDSHCHLYYEPYKLNLKKSIDECNKNNVNLLLSIGVDYQTSLENIKIAENFNEVYCTIGLHPNYVKEKSSEVDKIFNLIDTSNKIIGIGECGIDLFRSKDNLKEQVKYFELQIEFAIKKKLPLIIHSRDSHNEIIKVLNNYKNFNFKFVMHCFSGSINYAKKYLDLGGYVSFSGILTFKNATELHNTCKEVPLDKILVETDSPYLSPHPFRGKTNHPKNTVIVAKKLAEIKNLNFDAVSKITTNNFCKLFNIKYLVN